MSWFLEYKKYQKLIKELLFHNSELEFQKEVLREAHIEFDKYQIQYCLKNNINLENLREQHSEKIEKIIQPPGESSGSDIVPNNKQREKKEEIKQFTKIYKLIAKKIHPDVFANRLRTQEIEEKEELFKKASNSFNNCRWAKFLEIAEMLNIKPTGTKEINVVLKKKIESTKDEIEKNKNMYSWMLYECEDRVDCKDSVMKHFLNQVFGI